MSRSIRKFIKNIFRAQLTDEEHLTMRGALQIFMREHPLQSPIHDTKKTTGFSGFLLLVRRPLFVTVALVLIVLVGTSTVAYAAESALPGDLLYLIKVNVNESLRAAVAISPKAKAEWNITRVERRLQEAETLIDRGELDADNSLALTERFSDHSDELKKDIEDLRDHDDIATASQIAADFQATISAHHKIITRLQGDDESESIATLTDSLEAQTESGDDIESTITAQVAAQSDDTAEESVSHKRQVAKNELQGARAQFNQIQTNLDAETSAQIGAELERASSLVSIGDSHTSSPSLGDAFTSFQKAHGAAQEAQLLIKASVKFKKWTQATKRKESGKDTKTNISSQSSSTTQHQEDVDVDVETKNTNGAVPTEVKSEQKNRGKDSRDLNTNEIKLKIDTRTDSKIDL